LVVDSIFHDRRDHASRGFPARRASLGAADDRVMKALTRDVAARSAL
jgi:hypothetical protein